MKTKKEILTGAVETLAMVSEQETKLKLRSSVPHPSLVELGRMMDLVKAVVFPGFFDKTRVHENTRLFHIGVEIEELYSILKQQIAAGILFCSDPGADEAAKNSSALALSFIESLPEIKRLLLTDVEAISQNDPAVSSPGEAIFSYPVIQAMVHYRSAHALLNLGVPVLPRILTEMAHSATGIDIHPAAKIGAWFAIDHGTGVVIGATSVIGDHVTLYQGVTLGAKNFKYDDEGRPIDIPRHPVLEDWVTVYSNTSILGRVTIGHHSVIGGNIWLTEDVPPHSRLLQGKSTSI